MVKKISTNIAEKFQGRFEIARPRMPKAPGECARGFAFFEDDCR